MYKTVQVKYIRHVAKVIKVHHIVLYLQLELVTTLSLKFNTNVSGIHNLALYTSITFSSVCVQK